MEFALKYKDSDAMSVFGIHVGTAARVEKSCLGIARLVGIPGFGDPKIDKLHLVKIWLEGKTQGNG